jgi:hypothetical protein
MLGNFWVAAQLAASQEGLSSMELVIHLLTTTHLTLFSSSLEDAFFNASLAD